MTQKSKYYTSAQGYRDEDGMARNFTFIDYDVKPGLSGYVPDGTATEQHKIDRRNLIEKILKLPASLAPMEWYDFTVRGEDSPSIEWNEQMLSDEGIEFFRLIALLTLLRNRKDQVTKTY